MGLLEELFPALPTTQLQEAFDAVNGDTQRAVDLLCSQVAHAPAVAWKQSNDVKSAPKEKSNGYTSASALLDPAPAVVVKLNQPESLQFLAAMFEAMAISVLENALDRCGGNVENAVDFILTNHSDFSDDGSSISSGTDLSSVLDSSSNGARDDQTEASSTSSSSPSRSARSVSARGTPSGSSSSYEDDGLSSMLSSMFPYHDELTIKSVLRTHDYDINRAADILSRLSVHDEYKPAATTQGINHDQALAALLDIFPDRDLETLQQALARAAGDVDGAIDTVAAFKPPCDGSCVLDGYPCMLHSSKPRKKERASSADFGSRRGRTRNEKGTKMLVAHGSSHGLASRFLTSGPELVSPAQQKLSTFASATQAQACDPKEYRQLAHEYREQRNDRFRRAAAAFQKGDLTGRGSAAYYSEEGRELTSQMARWNNMAASTVIQRNQARLQNDPYTIDLHELTVQEAIKYVDEAVNNWYSRDGAKSKPRKPLKIITGAGQHSSFGVRKLYPAVIKSLKGKGWTTSTGGNGWFYVVNR
ncbi:hypothetical protein PhCBS80983_g04185 [Powellomyces hirtus]|uniref:Smr domain-containing protein n=1 Tax=Powellomyces hirtus TaxID=109895 RepID=A0A507E1G0_9FUNG|nr:hypothetical protein PhCBS80983_g04185 [Powellomyces hirtus]